MVAWRDRRQAFQKEFDQLAQQNVESILANLNASIGQYISSGGINQNSTQNPTYDQIVALTAQLNDIKRKYSALQDAIKQVINEQTKNNNLSTLLTENGNIQKKIQRLQKINDDVKVDVESALARDEVLRTRETAITPKQLFLLDRPVRRGMVPMIWMISVLFIGIALFLLKSLATTSPTTVMAAYTIGTSVTTTIQQTFLNRFVMVCFGICFITILIFGALKVTGLFGK